MSVLVPEVKRRQRRVVDDTSASALTELLIHSVLNGIQEGGPERPPLIRWVFNCDQEKSQFPFLFDQACAAVPFDPDVFRDSLEGMFPRDVFEATEGRYGWT